MAPANILTVQAPRFTAEFPYNPGFNQNFPIRVGVSYPPQRPMRTATHFNAQFLMQLAREGLQWTFTGFRFAAGKFPSAGQVAAGRPLRDQNPPAGINQDRSHHMNGLSGSVQPLACCKAPWQCLYLRPDPQGQGSLRPTLGIGRTKGATEGALERGSISMTLPPEPPEPGGSPDPESPIPGTA